MDREDRETSGIPGPSCRLRGLCLREGRHRQRHTCGIFQINQVVLDRPGSASRMLGFAFPVALAVVRMVHLGIYGPRIHHDV